MIEKGQVDLAMVGRRHLANPHFTYELAQQFGARRIPPGKHCLIPMPIGSQNTNREEAPSVNYRYKHRRRAPEFGHFRG